ncbi:hypothetical protein OG455_23920 [Kitasatospora sp. NBC_01287]|uniref:hypothetical protein n=1 Tax=Kitasatospora sp. NBC_01287 TaxID=2903573 RepID=UPI00225AB5D6|nr:hypothetical protein [Kitasatospora sp. NBC_01287]MCX4748526.1 hypothetical protein [Kitasatospora sp. NBC_01287]
MTIPEQQHRPAPTRQRDRQLVLGLLALDLVLATGFVLAVFSMASRVGEDGLDGLFRKAAVLYWGCLGVTAASGLVCLCLRRPGAAALQLGLCCLALLPLLS